jgi:hypothetical protein
MLVEYLIWQSIPRKLTENALNVRKKEQASRYADMMAYTLDISVR